MYEFSNYLGIVICTINDCKLTYGSSKVDAEVLSYSDYYPFGMTMPGRNANAATYRHGFNGMEKDDELKGSGNSYDFGARMYDPRLNRWLAVDPLASKYPALAPYVFVGNSCLRFVDPDGKKIVIVGNAEYQTKVKAALDKLAANSSTFRAMYERLVESDNLFVISDQGENGLSNKVTNKMPMPENGPNAFQVRMMFNFNKAEREGGAPTVELALAHEMIHFLQMELGMEFGSYKDAEGDMENGSEANAVNIEAKIAADLGVEWRTDYSGVEVINKEACDPTGKTGLTKVANPVDLIEHGKWNIALAKEQYRYWESQEIKISYEHEHSWGFKNSDVKNQPGKRNSKGSNPISGDQSSMILTGKKDKKQ